MDLWGKRLVETSNGELIGLNQESIFKLGTLIQNGTIEHTLSSIGDKDFEDKVLKAINSYVQAYYFVRGLPERPSSAYPGEISRLFGLKKAGCSGKSATLLVALD